MNINEILTFGGDSRIFLNKETNMNRYGSSFFPDKNLVTFSSTTSTSMSEESYKVITDLIKKFNNNDKEKKILLLNDLKRNCLKDVKNLFNLENSQVFLTSSGTESLSTVIKIISDRSQEKVTSVLCASDETASGASSALSGRYFDAITMFHEHVNKGEKHKDKVNETIEIKTKNTNGNFYNEEEIRSLIDEKIKKEINKNNHVILVAANQSKLGVISPLPETIDFLNNKYKSSISIVIDACQLRMGLNELQDMINKNYFILITGSKFLTGIPFSGGIVVSEKIKNEYNFHLFDSLLPEIFQVTLEERKINAYFGILLRWVSAITEAKKLINTVPINKLYKTINNLSENFYKLISEKDFIIPLFNKKDNLYDYRSHFKDELSSLRTIFPFFVLKEDGSILSYEKLCKIYELLISSNFRQFNDLELNKIMSTKCLIGQPVAGFPNNTGVLRVSIGARMLQGDGIDDEFTNKQFNNLNTVFKKIDLIRKLI